jgi:hypothetical protein
MPACNSQYIKKLTAAKGWQNDDLWAAQSIQPQWLRV